MSVNIIIIFFNLFREISRIEKWCNVYDNHWNNILNWLYYILFQCLNIRLCPAYNNRTTNRMGTFHIQQNKTCLADLIPTSSFDQMLAYQNTNISGETPLNIYMVFSDAIFFSIMLRLYSLFLFNCSTYFSTTLFL